MNEMVWQSCRAPVDMCRLPSQFVHTDRQAELLRAPHWAFGTTANALPRQNDLRRALHVLRICSSEAESVNF
jgi:hypothetical protein